MPKFSFFPTELNRNLDEKLTYQVRISLENLHSLVKNYFEHFSRYSIFEG